MSVVWCRGLNAVDHRPPSLEETPASLSAPRAASAATSVAAEETATARAASLAELTPDAVNGCHSPCLR